MARVRVRFASPIPADLLVVRGCADPCRAAVVPAGADGPVDAGPLLPSFGALGLDGTSLAAVEVTTADVTNLAEVSVWSPVPDGVALEPIEDPARFGADDDDGARRWAVLAAGALVVAMGVALGAVIGRRRRPASTA